MTIMQGDKITNQDVKYKLITEAELNTGSCICVYKEKLRPHVYHVCVDEEVKHPELNADAALCALGHYLQNVGHV